MPVRTRTESSKASNPSKKRAAAPPAVEAWGDVGRAYTIYANLSFTRTGDVIPCKGTLALDWVRYEIVDPDVLAISRDTVEMEWWDGREWLKHRPTYAVLRKGRLKGETITTQFDLIWSRQLARPEERNKFVRLQIDAKRRLIDYRVKTEKDLVQPRVDNAKIIMAQAGEGQIPLDDEEVLSAFVRRHETFTLDQVVASKILDYPRAYAAVLNRVASGRLSIDLGRLFDGSSLIRRGKSDA